MPLDRIEVDKYNTIVQKGRIRILTQDVWDECPTPLQSALRCYNTAVFCERIQTRGAVCRLVIAADQKDANCNPYSASNHHRWTVAQVYRNSEHVMPADVPLFTRSSGSHPVNPCYRSKCRTGRRDGLDAINRKHETNRVRTNRRNNLRT